MKKCKWFLSRRVAICLGMIMMVCLIPVIPVQAAGSNKTVLQEYKKILENQQYVQDSGGMETYAEFILYDINGDGQKELLVSGSCGVKGVGFTVVYSYIGNKITMDCVEGTPIGISNKGLKLRYDDQMQAGMIVLAEDVTYQLNKKGTLVRKLSYYVEREWNGSDMRVTQRIRNKYNGETTTKISRKSYEKLQKKYKLKSVGVKGKVVPREVNEANIKKYLK
jgi:hypothetical protein